MKNKQYHEAISGENVRRRDEALDRVGAKLFGPYWFNGADVDEAGRTQLPKDPKRAAEIARLLQHPFMTYNWQVDAVIHWLQHEHGLDCEAKTFDGEKSARFEEFFLANFGPAAIKVTPLDAAILKHLKAGRRLGGGGRAWKDIRKDFREEGLGDWTEKTIQRHVKKLLAQTK